MIIVEPHADDAFLSMGGLIEEETKAGRPVTIVTVYSGTRHRAADAKAYAQAVGAEWVGLGYVETGNARENGAAPLPGLDERLAERTGIELGDPRTWVLPLALTHPEHVLVRHMFLRVFERHDLGFPVLFYLDQPYASKLKNQPVVQAAVAGRRIAMLYRPSARKYRHTALFKDQQKFFHFNPPSELEMKGIELVVE